MEGVAIGIDLGTTNSAVSARLPDGRFVIIPPEGKAAGRVTLPSVVAFNRKGQHLIGYGAQRIKSDGKRQLVLSSVKRLLGRTYAEAHAAGLTPTALGCDPLGRAHDLVRYNVPSGHRLTAEEVVALLLRGLKERAERFLGQPVTRAVIGVPARYSLTQRRALQHAADLAGIRAASLVVEPELAIRAYGLRFNPESCKIDGEEPPPLGRDKDGELIPPTMRHILVADLGGGTFDVTVVRQLVEVDELHVLYTAGDERLGGDDFDDALTDWAALELKTHLTHTDRWPLNDELRRQLRVAVRKAKERLSGSKATTVNFHGGKVKLTRLDFNLICVEPLRRMLLPIREAAHGAKVRLPFEQLAEDAYDEATKEKKRREQKQLSTTQPKRGGPKAKIKKVRQKLMARNMELDETQVETPIDEVVCVGAATWTPAVRDLLELITGVEPSVAFVDPESAVVMGAAVVCGVMDDAIPDMQVQSRWRLAWAEHLLKQLSEADPEGEMLAVGQASGRDF